MMATMMMTPEVISAFACDSSQPDVESTASAVAANVMRRALSMAASLPEGSPRLGRAFALPRRQNAAPPFLANRLSCRLARGEWSGAQPAPHRLG